MKNLTVTIILSIIVAIIMIILIYIYIYNNIDDELLNCHPTDDGSRLLMFMLMFYLVLPEQLQLRHTQHVAAGVNLHEEKLPQ